MSKFADELLESLTEAVAHAWGKQSNVRIRKLETPKSAAVFSADKNTKISAKE